MQYCAINTPWYRQWYAYTTMAGLLFVCIYLLLFISLQLWKTKCNAHNGFAICSLDFCTHLFFKPYLCMWVFFLTWYMTEWMWWSPCFLDFCHLVPGCQIWQLQYTKLLGSSCVNHYAPPLCIPIISHYSQTLKSEVTVYMYMCICVIQCTQCLYFGYTHVLQS